MHVVVVDPSRTVLKAVSRLLESDGHVVSAFTGGQDALDFIKATADVHALITSAELGPMTGIELCWETRLLCDYDRAIYIILMSSNSDRQHLINALDSGADEFIAKPPAAEELYARLRCADRLLRLQHELVRLATTDPLTGLFNRRAFFSKGSQSCLRATGSERPTAIMFDVDHFKRVNDLYGHDVGDQVLRAIGSEAVGERATVGRLGGEEFAILLEASNLEAGMTHAEGLREKLAALSFEIANGKVAVTCSFGVAEWQPGETIDRLLKRADAALYQAKNGGRNRVVVAELGDLDVQWSGVVRTAKRSPMSNDGESRPLANSNELLTWWASDVEESMSPSSPTPDASQSCSGSAYVLDDEPQIGALVCKVLAACGLAPQQFTSPTPFLAELKTSPPDLIVLDLSLGQSDAVEIIRHLEVAKYQGKVILISGRDETTLNEITEIGKRHGLVMLPPLKKPFRAGDVKQRLAGQVADPVQSKAQDSAPDAVTPKKALFQVVEALRNNWLELWYQPKIDLKTLSVCGAEGLVRAKHPLYGIVMPEQLLPPAGDPEYRPLTEFVIERAMADWAGFAKQGHNLNLSINAPVSVIKSPEFVDVLRSARPREPNFPGLTVEVTEDEVIRDSESMREVANQLKLYNIGFSIDDFGAGYAALSRLADLPFVEVKIDCSFVAGCASNKLKHGLCQTVVDLAHRFGATACAEGVETAEDLRALIEMQCDTAQGFLFAKPMPADQLAATLLAGSEKWIRAMLNTSASKDQWLTRSA
jgi:two-component system cell cycle response regulator